ncbi:hypothetical protein BS50DRAFT_275072 [Corynespora cassiicola Philippines]|uniref:Uncharacterized protein n=1 Tax=Corynespora cassiicola Philippines TaxID=1448308 RepID=A0A2T2P1C2_CORCC|nr:hypothetical protein BS50DRAFT_275072 [Corynespora cassiicola Philippines]
MRSFWADGACRRWTWDAWMGYHGQDRGTPRHRKRTTPPWPTYQATWLPGYAHRAGGTTDRPWPGQEKIAGVGALSPLASSCASSCRKSLPSLAERITHGCAIEGTQASRHDFYSSVPCPLAGLALLAMAAGPPTSTHRKHARLRCESQSRRVGCCIHTYTRAG